MAAKDETLVSVTVARGLLVWGKADEPLYAGPGEVAQVGASEVDGLLARGVIVDTKNGPAALAIGPAAGLDSEAGPVVKTAES